jgi:hypothetical protein
LLARRKALGDEDYRGKMTRMMVIVSACGNYRYLLTRELGQAPAIATLIMLNRPRRMQLWTIRQSGSAKASVLDDYAE